MSSDLYLLILIFVCFGFSAFFSAAETAITSLGVIKAKHLVNNEDKPAKHLSIWLTHPNRVLTTILIFNNVVNVFSSVLATILATSFFDSNAIGIATGSVTLMLLIFGEVVPKSVAKANPEVIGLFAIRIIKILYYMTFPLVWALAELAKFIVARVSPVESERPIITEDEIEYLINKGDGKEVIEDTKRDMISSVFEFDETKVREIMTPRTDIIAFDEDTVNFDEVIQTVVDSGHSRIPVYKDRIDNIVGIVLAKDLLKINYQQIKKPKIKDIMRETFFVSDSRPIMEVFKKLKRTKNHLAIVVDEYGGTAGLVTMEDILEEIVGEIQDEYDAEEAKILEVDRGIFDVAGSVNLEDFIEFFELEENESEEKSFEESEADTVGGWITTLVGDLPKVGQTIHHGELQIKVIKIGQRRIERLRVTKILS